MTRKKTLSLLIVIFIAAFFRLYRLGEVPPSPSLDEVSIGWNAYSLLETGRDEYGYRFPILLRAYDDWRPAGYVYLVIPFVKLLGLTVTAVRLPSVLLSLAAVLLTYHLTRELFSNNVSTPGVGSRKFDPTPRNFGGIHPGGKSSPLLTSHLPLLTSLLLAVSPWHMYLSRLGHEVNAGLTFSLAAIYFLVKWLNRPKPLPLFLSAGLWAISFYTYQSLKVFAPVLLVTLSLLYFRKLTGHLKHVGLAGLAAVILLLPVLKVSLSPETNLRFKATNLFNHIPETYELSARRLAAGDGPEIYLARFFDNRRFLAFGAFTHNYLIHFNPAWWLTNTGAEPHKVPSLGLIFWWEAVLLVAGLAGILKRRNPLPFGLLLVVWVLTAPLAGAITTDAPHAMRAIHFLPLPQIVAAVGLTEIAVRFKNKKRPPLAVAALGAGSLIFIFSVTNLYHHYFTVFPREQSASFQAALVQALRFAGEEEDNYENIIVTNQGPGYQSYMFYLFYSRFDPRRYLADGGTGSGGFNESHQVGKYHFRPVDFNREPSGEKNLYLVSSPTDREDVSLVRQFNHLNGETALYAFEKE